MEHSGTLIIKDGHVESYELSDPIPHRLEGYTEANALAILSQYGWEKHKSDGLPHEDHTVTVGPIRSRKLHRPVFFKSERY